MAVWVSSKFAHANHQQPKQTDFVSTSSVALGAEIASHMLCACSFKEETFDGAEGRSLSDFSSNRFVTAHGKQHSLLAALFASTVAMSRILVTFCVTASRGFRYVRYEMVVGAVIAAL
ncbi:hypothetical protein PMIN03_007393 [Paraphaeosphaeria minitans]